MITTASPIWAFLISIFLTRIVSVSALAFNSTIAGFVSPAAFTNASLSSAQSDLGGASLTPSSLWDSLRVMPSGSDADGVDGASLTRSSRHGIVGAFDTDMHEVDEPRMTRVIIYDTDMHEEDVPTINRMHPWDTVIIPHHRTHEEDEPPRTRMHPWDTVFVIDHSTHEEDEPPITRPPHLGGPITIGTDGEDEPPITRPPHLGGPITIGTDSEGHNPYLTEPPWLSHDNVSSTGSSLGDITRHNTTQPTHLGTAISFSNATDTEDRPTITRPPIPVSVIATGSYADDEEESTITQAPEPRTTPPLPATTTITKTFGDYRVLILPAHENWYDPSSDTATTVDTVTVYSDPPTSTATAATTQATAGHNAKVATPADIKDMAQIILPAITGASVGVAG